LFFYQYQGKKTKITGLGFTILNKSNDETIKEYLTTDIELELQMPYILYKNCNNEIKGIWFSDAATFMTTSKLMKERLNDIKHNKPIKIEPVKYVDTSANTHYSNSNPKHGQKKG